jgi:hypothetical protein
MLGVLFSRLINSLHAIEFDKKIYHAIVFPFTFQLIVITILVQYYLHNSIGIFFYGKSSLGKKERKRIVK